MSSDSTAADQPAKRKDDTEVLPQALQGAISREPLQVGPYRILGVIGRGGMGTVYRGQVVVSCEVPMGRQVAIKILRHIADKQERLRFSREAGYLQALRHPGIVRVLDVGDHHGQPYLVMQLVEGQPLSDLISEKSRLGENQVADVGIQALEALHVAHLAGILHRDIKPSNLIMNPQGLVKLVDFGLAQRMDASSRLTATGTVIGTPAYMSPEQASGERADLSRRSDVYSVGACLYELLTGHQPFTADNSVAVLRKILDEPVLPPSHWVPTLSNDLETIVLKAMSKHPNDRYPNAELMAEDLRQFHRGLRIRSRRPGRLRPFLRQCWINRGPIAAVGLVVFVFLVILLIGLAQLRRRAPDPALAQDPAALIDATWVSEWRHPGTLDNSVTKVRLKPYTPLGKGIQLATLPPVQGPVRISLTFTATRPKAVCSILICDRDVGRGYRVSFIGDVAGDQLQLLREDKVVASRDLGRMARFGPIHLDIERVEDTVTASVSDRPSIEFIDLTPIEGSDADGVYIASSADAGTVSDIHLERRRSSLYVTALAPADLLRQDGRFARAIREYEAFLRDHPTSPLARDARFRIGLCHEALKDDEQALASFLAVIQNFRDQPRYVLSSTFRAWGCALRLGRYQEAEQYFDAIRSDYDLASLLASVPQDILTNLVKDYTTRAAQLANDEPLHAASLYGTGADLATYLGIPAYVSIGSTGAGDILLSLGRIQEAIGHFSTIADNQQLQAHFRMKARLKIAEAERLRDRFDAARRSYQEVIDNPTEIDNQSQWARLWLGDLYLQLGDLAQARECWKSSPEAGSPPGAIMRHLLEGTATMPLGEDRHFANDIEYFNARWSLIRGDAVRYFELLSNTVRVGPTHDWPTSLARHLLEDIDQPGPEALPAPSPDDPAAAPGP